MSVLHQLLVVAFITYASAQWLRYEYVGDYRFVGFLNSATPEQIQQFNQIISQRELSAEEYNEQMDAFIGQLSEDDQKAYKVIVADRKKNAKIMAKRFIEKTSVMSEDVQQAGKIIAHIGLESGTNTPTEIWDRILAVLRKLPSRAQVDMMQAYRESIFKMD